MRSRHQRYLQQDFPLPWPLEVAFWVFGLTCGLLASWLLTSGVKFLAETLGKMQGVPVEAQSFVDPAQPLIWLFGFVVCIRVRCWLRRIVVDALNKAL